MRPFVFLAAAALALGACASSTTEADRVALAAEAFRWDVEMSERDLARVRADVAVLEQDAEQAALLARADELSEIAARAHATLDHAATAADMRALREDLDRLREGVDDLRLAALAAGS